MLGYRGTSVWYRITLPLLVSLVIKGNIRKPKSIIKMISSLDSFVEFFLFPMLIIPCRDVFIINNGIVCLRLDTSVQNFDLTLVPQKIEKKVKNLKITCPYSAGGH